MPDYTVHDLGDTAQLVKLHSLLGEIEGFIRTLRKVVGFMIGPKPHGVLRRPSAAPHRASGKSGSRRTSRRGR
jgi:hypothetical protein